MEQQKSAFVAIVGRPNAGKSSLMNALLGQKVVIVSDKPQTTRTRIMGVLTEGCYQYVFIDTPGFHKPRTTLGENMIKAVGAGMDDVELCVLVVDATKPISPIEEELIEKFHQRHLPAILVINKIDLVKNKEDLMSLIADYSSRFDFAAVVPTSAISGDGVHTVKQEIQPFAQDGIHMFDEDTLTDQPERLIAAELIREKLLRLLDKEIPHGIAVVIEGFHVRQDPEIIDVDATIFCEKSSHKGIIIGKGGTMLKRAASYARRDLEQFFDCKINLQCWVKVKEDWRNREGLIHSFGLDS